jgi:RimJ/RimL family protein N-acetyltransferase
VSSATTFSPFIDEFETEVNTVNDSRYRGRGFATSVAAALLMYALEHNIVPHWDAENDISGKIAFKLGYSNPEPYKSLYIKQL